MAYIAKTDGTQQEIDPKTLTLEQAQKIVGGYVERVFPRLSPDVIILCDEDALMKKVTPKLNVHGSALYGNPVLGDIIVIYRNEKCGFTDDLREGQ